ncbi:uncharacterized protein EMH_0088510 [Eimeria mitis]|uniref:Uncharacterized protein n=1 Tax=Eimeria mitis TaxID=44415 RepID=U6K861_9EIME|nr:uncharacterized protein EMH_0088510 [Eimeria mitis]CDJ34200.1 hypothetical protein, conserved [Eimeria mitis]
MASPLLCILRHLHVVGNRAHLTSHRVKKQRVELDIDAGGAAGTTAAIATAAEETAVDKAPKEAEMATVSEEPAAGAGLTAAAREIAAAEAEAAEAAAVEEEAAAIAAAAV